MVWALFFIAAIAINAFSAYRATNKYMRIAHIYCAALVAVVFYFHVLLIFF